MAKLSAATRHALNIIAHAAMARDLDKNVFQKQHGVKGFYESWLKQNTAADRAIIADFEKLCRDANKEMVRLLAQDVKK